MKASALIIAVVVFAIGGAITFAVIRWLDYDNPELAFVVGAITATQAAVIIHHRSPGAANTLGVKLLLGAVLAVAAAIFGLVLHSLFAPFKFADLSIAISTLGTFVFPFAIFNPLWSALSKAKGA